MCAIRLLFIFILTLLALPAFADSLNIRIFGVPVNMAQDLKKELDNQLTSLPQPLTADSIRDFYQHTPQVIDKALQAYGYFKAHLQHRLDRQNGVWVATYTISLGPPLLITSFSLQINGPGRNNPIFIKLLQNFPIKRGDVLNSKHYEEAKQSLYDIAQQQGYLASNLTEHVVRINAATYSADVILHFDTGPQYYFGPVSFNDNPYALSLLRRYVPFKTGDVYSPTKLFDLQTALNNSTYFQSVTVTPQQQLAVNRRVPIRVNLVPRKAHQYSIGVGYGTDTGARMTLGLEWRRVTPTGHYLQTLLQVSQQKQNNNFQARYIIPGRNPATDHYTISAGLFTNHPGDSQYFTQQVGANYVSQICNDWQQTIALDLQHERFEINNGPYENSTNLIPSIMWEKIDADNRINTNRGYRVSLELQGAAIASDVSFAQAHFQGKIIRSFNNNNGRILLRSDLGLTTVSELRLFPASQRFYAGGSLSVRGYGFQDLGPGLYIATASAELQHKIHGKFYGAVFFDMGNAVNELPMELKKGAGLGVLYRSPIGPIEVTVAKALDADGNGFNKNYKIQVVMGADL